ncbi:TetR family transcriptional regulator [Actinorhabdospora filicis]|uniref:TetR family transcriptional regulator n=1 Tax=Actinorhabdospora filicis TaxID=1785913 RepID=A0A9W6SHP6_9ACTN|nr:TetR/AcrR family transcriptional regulator [Actinorhabdospora filicis]GLZ77324.1 TetR family transcriptional regulator [Actinorhabdospora filicis]
MTETQPGLRELRKRETRQKISDTATRMFIERGFDAVTIAEIAKEAQVAKMTVTNYFPRKEDLVFDMQDEFTRSLARAVRDRRVGESAAEALRRDFLERLIDQDPSIGFTGQRFGTMIAASAPLTARLREFYEDRETALAETLTEETKAAPDDPTPRIAAAQLAGTLRVLFDDIKRRNIAGDHPDAIVHEVTLASATAFAILERGLGDYALKR